MGQAIKLLIRGMVQGVGYRYSMIAQAEAIGITGYVMNREDGSVEAVIQGQTTQTDAMIEWARKGPSGARVESVDISPAAGVYSDFSIKYPTS